MKVGFIGVGNMGGPMCRNIIRNTNHDVVVFDLNRSLTGMGHERYRSADVTGHRPVDELARRLFATGAVTGVHVYSNVVTVELAKGNGGADLDEVIRDLVTYYR